MMSILKCIKLLHFKSLIIFSFILIVSLVVNSQIEVTTASEIDSIQSSMQIDQNYFASNETIDKILILTWKSIYPVIYDIQDHDSIQDLQLLILV